MQQHFLFWPRCRLVAGFTIFTNLFDFSKMKLLRKNVGCRNRNVQLSNQWSWDCEFWYISKFYFWKDRIFIILELSPKLYFYKRSFHIKFTKDIILLWLIARCTSRLPQRKWWLVIEMILMITFTEVFSSSNFRMRMPLKKWMNVENWGKSYDLLK